MSSTRARRTSVFSRIKLYKHSTHHPLKGRRHPDARRSSINGQKGQLGQANYSAAKAGELGFTKSLALEGARKGITVNSICPGYINTDMVKAMSQKAVEATESQIPVGHLGEPEDIARCVQFLVADEASFITGSTITANGGHYLI